MSWLVEQKKFKD